MTMKMRLKDHKDKTLIDLGLDMDTNIQNMKYVSV